MKFVSIKYRKFTFDLSEPLTISSQTIRTKNVIIIKAIDEEANCFYSEVSPLGGFSSESIEDCEAILNRVINNVPIRTNELLKIADGLDHIPSLKFGIEQLLLNLNIFYGKITFSRSIKLNKLIGIDSVERILFQIEDALKKGYETIKLKIGRPDFRDDYFLVKKIINEYGNDLNLRLDNNGSWCWEEAVYNTGLLSEFNIQYIEQPLIKNTELLELAEISKIAVAPDESVGNIEDAIEFINSEKISYLILKPSLRIGISNTIKLRESAKRKNVKLIITSGFDTALGRSALLYLASLMDHDDAHGLSAELLGKNEFIADINFSSPRLSISQTNFLFKSVIEV